MMKKVVPLAVLIGAAAAVDNNVYDSTWTAVTTAYPAGTATNCCFFTGDVQVSSSGLVTGTASGSKLAADASANPAVPKGPCYGYANTAGGGTSSFNPSSGTNLNLQLTTPTAAIGPAATSPAGLTADGQGASITTTADGSSAIITLAPSGPATVPNSCQQTLTRKIATAPSSDFVGSWTVGAAGSDTSCCYLVPGTLAIVNANSLTKASGVKTQDTTACASHPLNRNTDYTVTLEPGSGNSIANTVLSGSTADKFTLNDAKTTITWAPLSSATCSQTFTKVSGSALNLALSPVVVGVAALGLAVV